MHYPPKVLNMLSSKPISNVPISYLSVHNAHNGVTIRVPKPIRFHTLATFKTFIVDTLFQDSLCQADNLFLLTSFGIKLNFNMIDELSEIFAFDKRLFSPDFDDFVIKSYINQKDDNINRISKPAQRPLIDEKDSQNTNKLTGNLKIHDGWSKALLQDCYSMDETIKVLIKEINTIFKSLNIIFQFGTNFTNAIEKNFNSYFNYIKLLNMKTLNKSWLDYYNTLKKFPTISLKNHKISNEDGDVNENGKNITIQLVDFLDIDKLKGSSEYISDKLPLTVDKFNTILSLINKVNKEKVNTDSKIEHLRNESMEAFKDHEKTIANSINETASLNQTITKNLNEVKDVKEYYQTHMNDYSSRIYDNALKLFEFLQQLKSFKVKLINESLEIFRTIADLQMRMVGVKTDLKKLTNPADSSSEKVRDDKEISFETINKIKSSEDYLSLTIDLPLLFGFIIIEKRRQFEWYDFYSKGIVSTLSEQLATIIDHEKVFQKLWLRKFNNFLTLLDENHGSKITLPNIDITLVNNNFDSTSISVFKIFDCRIEREDISNYIKLVKVFKSSSSSKFSDILEKNFKDLVRSTENMQKVTKLVTSLSAYTSPNINNLESSKIKNNGEIQDDGDFDLNLIKGLKTRIKKLENLLHQQQYKNISNWPVTKSQDQKLMENTKMSLILDANNKNQLNLLPSSKSSINNNPTLLLNRRHTSSSPRSHNGSEFANNKDDFNNTEKNNEPKVLDASTTIDKHLDNIRLKKQNSELIIENEKLSKTNQSNETFIANLRDEISQIKNSQTRQEESLKSQLSKKDLEIEQLRDQLSHKFDTFKSQKDIEFDNLHNKLSSKDDRISDLQNDIAKFTKLNTDSSQEIYKLNEEIKKLRIELNDSSNMKSDLLSNMTSKEFEFVNERNDLENEIKQSKLKIDELTEDYENLMELTQAKHKHNENFIEELNGVIVVLFKKIKILIDTNYDYVLTFCYVLESMGLLLVKEFDEKKEIEEFKITRVKGLKSKKTSGDDTIQDASIITSDKKLNSKVLDDILDSMKWSHDIVQSLPLEFDSKSEVKSILTAQSDDHENEDEEDEECPNNQLHEQATKLITVFNNSFINPHNNFDKFVKLISFKENVHLKTQETEDTITNENFFLNAISKRFKDVEGFAKKLTKENKSKLQEVNRLISKSSGKITINSFASGDLVLFLPTRIERDGVQFTADDSFQPWAAFNIGAPHYFLNTKAIPSGREWIVGKVTSIQEHKVSYDTNNKEDNPFQLSVGVTWYMVEATDEGLEHV